MSTQAMNYTAQDIVALMESMKIIAQFISNSQVQVRYNNTGVAKADMDAGIIHIPRMGDCKHEDLMKLRTFTYHEAGHIIETNLRRADLPTNPEIFKIWNALEDVRMEAVLMRKHHTCRVVLEWAADYFNRTNGAQLTTGDVKAPFWEALCALMFSAKGRVPSWSFTCDLAKWYFETAYAKFMLVSNCKNAKETIKLAEEIYELLKNKIQEDKEKKQQEKKEKQEKQKQKQSGSDGEQQEGEDGEDEQESKQSKKSKSKKGKDDEDNDPAPNGSDESENSDEQEEDKDSEGGEGEESDSDDNSDDEADEGESSESEDDDDGEDSDISPEEQLKRDMEGGHDLIDEQLVKEIKDAFKESDNEYTSITDHDTYIVAKNDANNQKLYKERKEIVGGAIMGMSRNLEQALRSMARVRKNPQLEHGKIDMRRMVAIGKSLSKKVFYNTTHGEALNTAVEIVIDESGSMSCSYLQMQLLTIALGETMSHLGIPFEIFGSTTGGQHYPLDGFTRTNPIRYNIYKAFGESWMSVAPRITNLYAYNNNVDGEVVKFAATRLKTRMEKRKVILSLSDGEPCGGQDKDDELAQNIINVCKDCRKNHIEVYGFGIGTREPAKFYGEEHFVYLDKATEMGEEFFRSFAQIVSKGRFTV